MRLIPVIDDADGDAGHGFQVVYADRFAVRVGILITVSQGQAINSIGAEEICICTAQDFIREPRTAG